MDLRFTTAPLTLPVHLREVGRHPDAVSPVALLQETLPRLSPRLRELLLATPAIQVVALRLFAWFHVTVPYGDTFLSLASLQAGLEALAGDDSSEQSVAAALLAPIGSVAFWSVTHSWKGVVSTWEPCAGPLYEWAQTHRGRVTCVRLYHPPTFDSPEHPIRCMLGGPILRDTPWFDAVQLEAGADVV